MNYLTKTKFKLALTCPTKLYYSDRKEYGNINNESTFMQSLADGGFQIAEVAKLYYPNGHMVKDLSYEKSLEMTNELLKKDKVVIYEAAFLYNDLFVRVDILVKDGNDIKLIEVKSKSYKKGEDIYNKKGELYAQWKENVYDVTYQKYVLNECLDGYNISSYLLMPNKLSKTKIDGLNSIFQINRTANSFDVIITKNVTIDDIGRDIMCEVNIDDAVENYLNGTWFIKDMTFINYINWIRGIYLTNNKDYSDGIGSKCKTCEYNTKNPNSKSGFKECWKDVAKFKDEDFNKPLTLDVWDFRKKNDLIRESKYFQSDLVKDDLLPKNEKVEETIGLSRVERQYIQINKSNTFDTTPYIDYSALKREIKSWVYPLHFIDFETSNTPLPPTINTSPYQIIAFQFSHHILHEDGKIEHKTEWINSEVGKFPNFDFVRALKDCLSNDNGSIFRYSLHENTVLNEIVNQLEVSDETDKDSLIKWIKTITVSSLKVKDGGWAGSRNMIDLCDVVKKYYYNPLAAGSNSIKYILPAVLNTSLELQEKYSKPIYGNEIASKNFKNWTWIEMNAEGKVIDPYKKLPTLVENMDDDEFEKFIENNSNISVADGGMAMLAYAEMQYMDISTARKDAMVKSLLKYCELDTMAMVMIAEHFISEVNK